MIDNKVSEIVIYRLNSDCTASYFWEMLDGFELSTIYDFVRHSHEKITREVWKAIR